MKCCPSQHIHSKQAISVDALCYLGLCLTPLRTFRLVEDTVKLPMDFAFMGDEGQQLVGISEKIAATSHTFCETNMHSKCPVNSLNLQLMCALLTIFLFPHDCCSLLNMVRMPATTLGMKNPATGKNFKLSDLVVGFQLSFCPLCLCQTFRCFGML